MIKLKQFKFSVIVEYFGHSFKVFIFVKKNSTFTFARFLDDNIFIISEIV